MAQNGFFLWFVWTVAISMLCSCPTVAIGLPFSGFTHWELPLRHLTIAVGGPDKQSHSLPKHNDPVVEKKKHYHPTALSKCPCNLHSDLPPENAISNLILFSFFLTLLLSSLILQIYMLSLPLHLRRFLFPEKPAKYQIHSKVALPHIFWGDAASHCAFSAF